MPSSVMYTVLLPIGQGDAKGLYDVVELVLLEVVVTEFAELTPGGRVVIGEEAAFELDSIVVLELMAKGLYPTRRALSQ